MAGKKRTDKDEEIRRLRERLKDLREGAEGEKAEGMAEGILHEVGRLLGMEGLLKKAANMHPIKERLGMIDAEIKERLAETSVKIPGKRTPGTTGPGRRSIVRTGPGVAGRPPRMEMETDIFDEGDYILVVASMPGVDEGSIGVGIDREVLAISFKRNGRGCKKELTLPCVPKGRMAKTFRNGVLEVRIGKKKKA